MTRRARWRRRSRPGLPEDLRIGKILYPETPERPRTRGDCREGVRPCPFVGCRHHLYLDVLPSGAVIVNSEGEVWDMKETCALDVADRGDHTLDAVGEVLGCTREAIRLVEVQALVRFRRRSRFLAHDET